MTWPQIGLAALIGCVLAWAWHRYSMEKSLPVAPSQQVAAKWRSVVAAIGLGTAVAEALLWVGLHTIWIGGFQTDLGVEWVRYNLETGGFRPVLFWWRIGVWLGAFPIVASGLGRGRLRKWGLIVSVVTFLVWLFPGHS